MVERESGPPFRCEICILAGGLSKRMGRDKAGLRLGAETMVGHIRTTAKRMNWPVRVIRRDLVPRCGPLGGVYTALKTTQSDALLFLACDMPFMGIEVLNCLVDECSSTPQPIFTSYRGRVGFPFVLPRWSMSDVVKQIDHREFSLQALAKILRGRIIGIPQRLVTQLRNVNTPREWESARKLWVRRKSNQ
jgi:molybdopterin-guanine dinucleotide biosynthesis protein A